MSGSNGSPVPQRIAVVGCSGSGKSTLAARIAAQLDLPYVATDAVFWTKDWRPAPRSEITAWLTEAVAADRWVTDGNFDDRRDILWERADMIVWLDLPFATTIWRGARRNLVWWFTGARVWGGLPMTLGKALSGLRHIVRSHRQKRLSYPAYLAAYSTDKVVRLTSPAEVEKWLTAAASGGSG